MSFTRDNVPARRVAQLVGLAGIVVGAVCLAAVFSTEPINVLIAVAAFVPLLLVLTCVGLLVSLVFRRWILSTLSVVILAVAAAVVAPLYVASGDIVDGPSMRVMQANLLFGEADPAGLVETARANSIDVLTVQELTDALAVSLDANGLEEQLPYQYLVPNVDGGGGAGIYSRYPLTETRQLEGFGPTNLVATIGFTTPFTLVAVHPGPAVITPPDVWTAELATLRGELDAFAAGPTPVLVSGDFNTSYLHKQFRDLLDSGYSDAADQLGSGIVPTYPADKRFPAVIGIDHVLMKDARARSLDRITIDGSDHHGLIVHLSIDDT